MTRDGLDCSNAHTAPILTLFIPKHRLFNFTHLHRRQTNIPNRDNKKATNPSVKRKSYLTVEKYVTNQRSRTGKIMIQGPSSRAKCVIVAFLLSPDSYYNSHNIGANEGTMDEPEDLFENRKYFVEIVRGTSNERRYYQVQRTFVWSRNLISVPGPRAPNIQGNAVIPLLAVDWWLTIAMVGKASIRLLHMTFDKVRGN